MIEMLGVLAIIGVLSVGSIAGYSKAMTKFKINKTIDQITMIANQIRTLFIHEQTYYGLGFEDYRFENSKNFVNLGIITSDMLADTPINGNDNVYTSIKNSFNGGIWIGCNTPDPKQYGSNADWNVEKAFAISFGGLNKDACMELATKNWNNIGVYSMGINTCYGDCEGIARVQQNCLINSDTYLLACQDYLPLSPSTVAKFCSICDKRKYGCSIAWGFRD